MVERLLNFPTGSDRLSRVSIFLHAIFARSPLPRTPFNECNPIKESTGKQRRTATTRLNWSDSIGRCLLHNDKYRAFRSESFSPVLFGTLAIDASRRPCSWNPGGILWKCVGTYLSKLSRWHWRNRAASEKKCIESCPRENRDKPFSNFPLESTARLSLSSKPNENSFP